MSTDTAVIAFRQPEAIDDPLSDLAREGARQHAGSGADRRSRFLCRQVEGLEGDRRDLPGVHKTLPARRRPPRCLRYKGTCQKGAPWFRSRRGTNWSGEENPVTD
jgi:hypothetical protein